MLQNYTTNKTCKCVGGVVHRIFRTEDWQDEFSAFVMMGIICTLLGVADFWSCDLDRTLQQACITGSCCILHIDRTLASLFL